MGIEDKHKVDDKPTKEDNKIKFQEILKHKYILLDILGAGTFGDVYKAEDLHHQRIVALKLTNFRNFSKHQINILSSEPDLLTEMNCPHIIKLYEVSETYGVFAQALEYCIGGDLHGYIKKNAISESDARNIMAQILKGVLYLHNDIKIIHRDLKPLNVQLKNNGISDSIRLADFGLAVHKPEWGFHPTLEGAMGTLLYMAPELVLNEGHDKKVDIWACGIILYNLLFQGKNPFYETGASKSVISENINNKEIDFQKLECSIEAKDLLKRMLEKDPAKRYLAGDALNHPWVIGKSISERLLTADELMSMFQARQDIKLAQSAVKLLIDIRKFNGFMRSPNRIEYPKGKLGDFSSYCERQSNEMNNGLLRDDRTNFLNRSNVNSKSVQNTKSKLNTSAGHAQLNEVRRSKLNLKPYAYKDEFGYTKKIHLMHDLQDDLAFVSDRNLPQKLEQAQSRKHLNAPLELPKNKLIFSYRLNASNPNHVTPKSRSGKKFDKSDVIIHNSQALSKSYGKSSSIGAKLGSKGSSDSITSIKPKLKSQNHFQTPENFRLIVKKPTRSQNEIMTNRSHREKSLNGSVNSETHIPFIEEDKDKTSNQAIFAKSHCGEFFNDSSPKKSQRQVPNFIRPVLKIKPRNLAPVNGPQSNLRLSKSSKNLKIIHNPEPNIHDDLHIPLGESQHEEIIQQYFDHKNQISNKGKIPQSNTRKNHRIMNKNESIPSLSPFSNKLEGSKSCKNMRDTFKKVPSIESISDDGIFEDVFIKNQQNIGNRNFYDKVCKSVYTHGFVPFLTKAEKCDKIFNQINYHHNIAQLYQSLAKWLSDNTSELLSAFMLNKRALQKLAVIKFSLHSKKIAINEDFKIECHPDDWNTFCKSDIGDNLKDIIDNNCANCSEVFNNSFKCIMRKYRCLKSKKHLNKNMNENIHKISSTVVLNTIKYLYSNWELSDHSNEKYITVCLYMCLLWTFDLSPDSFLLAEKMKEFIAQTRGFNTMEKMCYLKDFLMGKDNDLVQRISDKYAL